MRDYVEREDVHGIPRRYYRDVRGPNERAATDAALWTSTMESVAEASELPITQMIRALGPRIPCDGQPQCKEVQRLRSNPSQVPREFW